MAGGTRSTSFPEDSDVLMRDPFLDYINGILMDEGADDASYLQQVDGTPSYQAIFSSLQDIIASSPPVTSPAVPYAAAYGHPAQGAPNHGVSLLDIRQADSAISTSGHPSSKPQQAANSPATTHTGVVELHPEDRNRVQSAGAQSHKGLHAQGSSIFNKPPASADEHFSSDQSVMEDSKLEKIFASLICVEGHSSSTITSKNGRHKQKSTAGRGRSSEKHRSKVSLAIDVREVLISCAQAVARGDATMANQILHQIHTVYGASAHGTGMQRIAYIFSRALAARMRGTGVHEFEAMSCNLPSLAAVLRATKLSYELLPFRKVFHHYASYRIAQAAEGSPRLHVLDFGDMYGLQWPCLINELANRKWVNPSVLIITLVEFPQRGIDMARKLDETGQRLAAYAKACNILFEYHAIVSDKWENLDPASLRLSSDQPEVLVVNCTKRLRHVADDTDAFGRPATSARQKLLAFWRSLNPHLLVTTIVNGAHNSPFFVPRFRETLDYFTAVFDMLDTVWGDIPERLVLESGFYYRTIMNTVACEGTERVERPETYKKWHWRITKAGFEQMPIPSKILARSKSYAKQQHHKDFMVYDDEEGWMLMCWKGRALLAISTWKPAQHVS